MGIIYGINNGFFYWFQELLGMIYFKKLLCYYNLKGMWWRNSRMVFSGSLCTCGANRQVGNTFDSNPTFNPSGLN